MLSIPAGAANALSLLTRIAEIYACNGRLSALTEEKSAADESASEESEEVQVRHFGIFFWCCKSFTNLFKVEQKLPTIVCHCTVSAQVLLLGAYSDGFIRSAEQRSASVITSQRRRRRKR